MKTLVVLAACAAMGLTLPGAANAATANATKAPKMPKEHEYSYVYDIADQSMFRPATRGLDPALLTRKLTHNPREAANVDEQDQVRLPSTWWQPRIGFKEVTVAQMMNGPGPGIGPAKGPWTVTKAKSQGVTPGFQIKDSKGDKFLIKFDPSSSPEAATGADVVGSYLFWAAGYNVPENTIEFFRAGDLELARARRSRIIAGASIWKPLPRRLLSRARAGWTVPSVASRFPPGKPLGPFRWLAAVTTTRRSDTSPRCGASCGP
jgi:hypothetical protein